MIANHTSEVQTDLFTKYGRSGVPASGLMEMLTQETLLAGALERVRSTDGAATPGIDGVTAEALSARSDEELCALARDLGSETWRSTEPRWFRIGKGRKGKREVGALCMRDRVVHTALKQLLEPLLEPHFHAHSYGYRPGRSVPAALERLCSLLAGRCARLPAYEYALALDVRDCFPSIDHRRLLASLRPRIEDDAFLRTVERAIAWGAGERRRWLRQRRVGLVQGSPLSPLLSNQSLDVMDRGLERLSASWKRSFHFIRYSDDVLLLAEDLGALERARRKAVARARRMGFVLVDSRGAPQPAAEGIRWLGVEVRPREIGWESASSFGYHVPDEKVASMLERVSEMTELPSPRLDASVFQLAPWIRSLNEQLRSWHQAYDRADNGRDVFESVDGHARERVGDLLRSVLSTSRSEVEKRYGTNAARGFRTYDVDGTRLVVLSALAPRSRHNLVRRPTWARRAA